MVTIRLSGAEAMGITTIAQTICARGVDFGTYRRIPRLEETNVLESLTTTDMQTHLWSKGM